MNVGRKKIVRYKCKCGNPTVSPNSSMCRECHNAYQRANRKKHSELTDEQRKKANARAYANVYVRRGLLVKTPCEKCGNEKSEAHHKDYDKPLEVNWLCRKCHLKEHDISVFEGDRPDRIRSERGEQKTQCSGCGSPLEEDRQGKYRYCRECHRNDMRMRRGLKKFLNSQTNTENASAVNTASNRSS